jgi:predicted enzyme related to lactoylglutathione lyase
VLPLSPQAVAAILIFSEAPCELAAFYRDLVGLPLLPTRHLAPHFGCEIGQVYVAIMKAARAGKRGRPNGGEAPASGARAHTKGHTCVAFMVPDVRAAYRALKKAGVDFDFGPRRTPLGIIARFRDPDGNAVEVYEP